jgi:hypothetical protein
MGYDVHITRAAHWAKSGSAPISLEEWLAVVSTDPEMRLESVAEVSTPNGALRYENSGFSVWTGYSEHGVNGTKVYFDYRLGKIVVKGPNKEIRAKRKQLAARLHARAFGDDGEEY